MKNEKIITTRQLAMVLLLSMVALKVLLLPNLMAIEFGRDSYLFLFVMLLGDFAILVLYLLLIKRYPEMSFYEILDSLFGKIIAKIIFVLFMLFFYAKCSGVFQSTFVYLNENLYTTYNWFVFSLPFLFVLVFCSMRGISTLGRLLECTFPIIVVGFLIASGVGLLRADFTNLLPLFESGFEKLIPLASFSYWFGDYTIFIIFFGKIKMEKHFNKKIIISVLVGIILLVAFYAIVYARYGYNTITHTNAISDVLQVQPSSSDIGSFDWVLILLWDMALFLNFLMNAFGVTFCLKTIFPKLSQVVCSIAVAVAVFLVNYLVKFNIYTFVELAQDHLFYFSIVVQNILPNVIFLVSLIKHGKKTKFSKEPSSIQAGQGGLS